MVAIAVRGFQGVARTEPSPDPPLASELPSGAGPGTAPLHLPAGLGAPPCPRPRGAPQLGTGFGPLTRLSARGIGCFRELPRPSLLPGGASLDTVFTRGRHLGTFSGTSPALPGAWSHPAAHLAEPPEPLSSGGVSSEIIFPGPGLAANPVSAAWRRQPSGLRAVLSISTPAAHSSGLEGRQEPPPLRPPKSVFQCLGSHFQAERQRPRQAPQALPLTPPGKVREPALSPASLLSQTEGPSRRAPQRAQDPEERLRLESGHLGPRRLGDPGKYPGLWGSSSLQLGPDCGVLGQD